jgi:hypothetical protein
MQIGTRWHESQLEAIDAWREAQEDHPPRTEAIRRLVDQALAATPKRGRKNEK